MLPEVKYYPLVGITTVLDVIIHLQKINSALCPLKAGRSFRCFIDLLTLLYFKANSEITNMNIAGQSAV